MNFRSFPQSSLVLLMASLASSASAMPTLYPKMDSHLHRIKNNTNSKIIADHQKPNHFYVLPPDRAYSFSSVLGFPSANLNYCREMASLQDLSLKITADIEKNLKASDSIQARAEEINAKVQEAEINASQLKNSSEYLIQYSQILSEVTAAEGRIVELTDQYKKCEQNYQCRISVNDSIQSANRILTQLNFQKRNLFNQNSNDIRKYERALELVRVLKGQYEAELSRNGEYVKEAAKLQKQLHEMYSRFGSLDGGEVKVTFDSKWDENIEKIRNDNKVQINSGLFFSSRSSGYVFDKLPIENVIFKAHLMDRNSNEFLPEASKVRSYSINGYQGTGDIQMESFPSQVSAIVKLNLIGACPIVKPELFKSGSFSTTTTPLSFTAEYNFYNSFNNKIRFEYNESHFFERVVKSGTSGGFFNSKRWKSARETSIDTKVVKFMWDVTDPTFSLDMKERRQFEREVMDWVLSGMIEKIADPEYPASVDPAQPQRGAQVASTGLMSLCGTHLYCQGAAWTLKVLDAVFGRSTSTNNVTIINNVSQTVDFDESTPHLVTMSTVFDTDKPVNPSPAI